MPNANYTPIKIEPIEKLIERVMDGMLPDDDELYVGTVIDWQHVLLAQETDKRGVCRIEYNGAHYKIFKSLQYCYQQMKKAEKYIKSMDALVKLN